MEITNPTCLIIIVDDGKAARFPLAPAAKSSAASPQALPMHSVNIGVLIYLYFESKKCICTYIYVHVHHKWYILF